MSFLGKYIASASLAAVVGLSTASLATAQDKLVLRMQSGYAPTLSVTGESAAYFTKIVREMSGGNIDIRYLEPGAFVPSPEIFDAVGAGRLEMGYSWNGFQAGKIPGILVFNAIPFGPSHDTLMAWLMEGGGKELMNELYEPFNVHSIPCGILPAEPSGWFREEITSIDQFQGMKIRYVGLAADVMLNLGASPVLIPGNETFAALERGVIDAAEFSLPSVDKDSGFYKIAKHYYFPGWHQPSSVQEVVVNKDVWDRMSDSQRSIINVACGETIRYMISIGLAQQGEAMQYFRDQGVNIHTWSDEMMEAFRKAADEVMQEKSAEDENFKRAWDSLSTFVQGVEGWSSVAVMRD